MRKLLELVMIMVFCVSIASGSTIILISDTGYTTGGTPQFPDVDGEEEYQDSPMVDFLKSLGYTVDTSGMAGTYRDNATPNWTTDPTKLAALNAADLIIVSRKISSTYYDAYRAAWNELDIPILCQCGSLVVQGSGKWGWCTGSNAQQSVTVMNMDIVMGHELVDGFSDPVTVFDSVPAAAQNPKADAVWDSRSSVIGTYEDAPMLVDIPTGTDFDALIGTTGVYGVSGARRVYLGIYTYDDPTTPWDDGLTDDYKNLFAKVVDKTMNSTVKIVNDSPAHGAVDIPLDLANEDNDLVFTILDPNIVEVDVYLGREGDPNLAATTQNRIVEGLEIPAAGQYTVDLVGEIAELLGGKDYHWKVIGYEPNTVTSIPEPATAGPTWQFQTQPDFPVISGVSPEKVAAKLHDPNVIFTVEHENVDTFQWYQVGVGALSNDSGHGGVDEDTLVIIDIDEDDIGFYYCIGTAGDTEVTSEPYGELSFKELKHYFPFDSAEGNITLDVIGGFQARLEGEGESWASVEPNGVNSIVGGYLQLENPEATEYDEEYVTILGDAQHDVEDFADYPNITITAWVRQDTRDIGCVWDFGENQQNYFTFTMGYNEDLAKVEFRYEIGEDDYSDEYEVAFDRTYDWQFVAVTLDSDGLSKTYIDGEFKDSKDLRPPAEEGVTEVNLTYINKPQNYIGDRIYPSLPKFDGLIDELKIYNYILSDAEIAQEYIDVRGGYVCTEDYDLQAYDYDHNCRVDLIDIVEFVTKWLEHDRIYRP